MKSVLGTVYGSFTRHDGYYAQGVVSAGPTDYRAFRHLDAAFVSRLVESDHSGGASPARTSASPGCASTTSVRTRSPGTFSPATESAYCGAPVELKAFMQVVGSPY